MLQRPFCSINYSLSTSVCIYFEYWQRSNSIVHFQMIGYSMSKKETERDMPAYFFLSRHVTLHRRFGSTFLNRIFKDSVP